MPDVVKECRLCLRQSWLSFPYKEGIAVSSGTLPAGLHGIALWEKRLGELFICYRYMNIHITPSSITHPRYVYKYIAPISIIFLTADRPSDTIYSGVPHIMISPLNSGIPADEKIAVLTGSRIAGGNDRIGIIT
jgi:hypothetical protein